MIDSKRFTAVRLKYESTVLYSSVRRSRAANLEAALKALAILENIPYPTLRDNIERLGIVIEYYRSF